MDWMKKYRGLIGLLILAIIAIGLPTTIGLTWVRAMGLLSADAVVFASDAPAMDRFMARAMKGVYGDRVQICDGTADQVEINAALASDDAGPTVEMRGPTFHIAAPVVVQYTYSTLRGQGWETELEAATNLNDNIIELDQSAALYNVTVRDMRIDGNKDNQSDNGTGLDFTNSQMGHFENLKITNCKTYGIKADSMALGAQRTTENKITGCYVTGSGTTNIYLRYIYALLLVDNPYIAGAVTGNGIHMNSCGDDLISGNGIDQNAKNGIYLYDCWRINICDNRLIAMNGDDGVHIVGGDATAICDYLIAGNNFCDNEDDAIHCRKLADRVVITGNLFQSRTGTVTNVGVLLDSTVGHILIEGNSFRNDLLAAVTNNGADLLEGHNNLGWIAPGETRTYAVTITAGSENTTTYWQNPFPQNVWIVDANVVLSTAASATNPTYDLKIDTDGSGVPDGTAILDAIPDTAATYWSWSNAYGGDASGVQTGYTQLASNASTSDWVGFCIEDAAGADSAGTIYIKIMGQ